MSKQIVFALRTNRITGTKHYGASVQRIKLQRKHLTHQVKSPVTLK